jgi:Chaperone of endosialidase
MKRLALLFAMVIGLALMLNDTSSGGPPPPPPTCSSPGCNPTVSDTNGNTAGGTGALQNVVGGPDPGFSNTAFGFNALISNTTGNSNTALGQGTLEINTTGIGNTAVGLSALQGNTTGHGNTASGATALNLNTTGSENTALGTSALGLNTTGSANVALGTAALILNTTGNNNTAVGFRALQNSTGTKNIGIGYQAGTTLTSGNNNIYIGNQGAGDEFQTIRIGTAQTQTFIAGITAATVSGAVVMIDSATGKLGIATSSARYKQDISPMGNRSEKVLDLRPVTFAYKDDARTITHYGLIAEEVAAVYPDLVTRTASGEVQTVKYQELIPMLLNELQRQRHEFQQALQTQQQALQTQQQALQLQQQELTELRALVGEGRGKVVVK